MQPTAPTPEQIANVTEALRVTFGFAALLIAYAILSHRTEDDGPTRWQRWRAWLTERYVMSRARASSGIDPAVDPQVAATSTNDDQRIAMGGNGVNDLLTGNDIGLAGARDIIRRQAKLEALAALVKAGKVPQAEGIEIVFACTRSGRADSPYSKARAELLRLLEPPQYPPLTPEQRQVQQWVKAEPARSAKGTEHGRTS
jgi:hypothetical protein